MRVAAAALMTRGYPRVAARQPTGSVLDVLACRIFGHQHRFSADGPTMRWACERCGAAGGEKVYATAEEAARYASAFDTPDSARTTSHVTLSTLPLRLVRRLRRR